jgi:phage gp36-like protein
MPSPLDPYFANSPALKILRSPSANLVLGFFFVSFKERGLTQIPEEDLEVQLDQYQTEARIAEPNVMPLTAREYLTRWCEEDYRLLQKRFVETENSYVYQLTPHSEKALSWIEDLRRGDRRGYTTSDTRFTRIVSELRRIERDTNRDPEARRKELLKQRDAIDAELKQLRETGKVDTLDPTAVKDALHDLESDIDEFLSDFRSIEETFRNQARDIQNLYLEQQLSKGDLVEHVLDADEALRNRDQGRSYFGFRESITSVENREELLALTKRAAELAKEHGLDAHVFQQLPTRLYLEVTSVSGIYRRISGQLRRVVEEQTSQQTRYLMELLSEVRSLANACGELPNDLTLHHWEDPVRVNNLMEVGYWEAPTEARFEPIDPDDSASLSSLKDALGNIGKPLNLPKYRKRVAEVLKEQDQVSLRELVERYPIESGIVDVVAYVAVAGEGSQNVFYPETLRIDLKRKRQARYVELEKIVFLK